MGNWRTTALPLPNGGLTTFFARTPVRGSRVGIEIAGPGGRSPVPPALAASPRPLLHTAEQAAGWRGDGDQQLGLKGRSEPAASVHHRLHHHQTKGGAVRAVAQQKRLAAVQFHHPPHDVEPKA